MKKTQNVKGHGFMRKTKAFGLASGIALGATLLIGANTASADEATTATPSTTATANESKTVVVDEGLTETANKAKEAGLTVNAEPTKNIGTANTEEESAKLAEQAKKEVADQKAQIEKETADYQKAKSESGNQEKEIVKSIVSEPTAYLNASNGLQYLQDKDFIAGKTSLGTVKSNKGSVSYVAPSTTSVMMDDPATMRKFIENSQSGTNPTEMTIGYNGDDMLVSTSPIANKKTATKVVPVFLKEGEIVNYDVNVTPDSELGSLGVAKIQKSYSLDKSPAKNGKVVAFLSQQGSVEGQALIGGSGKAIDDLKEGDWTYTLGYQYYDKNGKVIPTNELFAKYSNKYLLKGKELVKPSDVTKKPEVSEAPYPSQGVGFEKTKELSVYGGNPAYFLRTVTEKISGLAGIKPVYYVGNHGAKAPTPVDTSKLAPNAPAKTVNYHLVSYTVNKPTATNSDKDAKGLVEVHYVVDNTERTVLKDPVIQTPESPIGTKYDTTSIKLPTITKDGKTYEVVRSEGTEKGQVVKGKTVVTYLYKLKEEPKPTPTPTPTPTPVEKPTTIHIDGNSGKEIAPKEDGTKPFKNIDGYEPSPKDPKNTEDPKGETVRVYNQIKKGNVEVRYVKDDASKTVLKDPVADTVDGKVGSDYDTTDHKPTTITKDGVTYELVRTEGVEKGKVVEGKTVVTYVYRQTVEPTTVHIDEEGNRIAPPEKGTKPFKNIDGFEPSPKDPKNVENPKGETVRVYKIVKGDVEVRYVKDDKERTVLKDPVADTTQAKVGTKYDTTDHKPVTITKDGVTYELVRTEGNEKGDVVKGKTVVTYVYREVQKPITIHIDTEGNPVAPQEDGTKPFKEIEGYKPAPSDSKNVEDPKGVTVRVYDKVKPEAPQEAPKTPEKPQPQQPATQAVATNQLPHTGSEAGTALAIAGLGVLGLSALVYKKKEN